MGLENGALDCRSWSLRARCPMESSRIAPAGGKQRAALYLRPAPVHTALSFRRDRRVYGGCVQSPRMVSGRDVRCRPLIRREVRPYLGAGMAQRKQLSRGSGRDACSHSNKGTGRGSSRASSSAFALSSCSARAYTSGKQARTKIGSAEEFVEVGISSCFPEGDKFGVGHGHALSFQQQVMQVLVATAASEQTRDVAVHCFHNSHRYFGVAVVANALQTDRAASGPASQTASTA